MVTPGERDTRLNPEDAGELLGREEARKYRGMTARGLYMSQDRSDVGYAVKELSRRMGEPREGDLEKMKRLARYLVGRERMRV